MAQQVQDALGPSQPGIAVRYQKFELDFLVLYHPKIAGKTGSRRFAVYCE